MSFLSLLAYLAKLITECILFLISWLVQNKVIFKKKDLQLSGAAAFTPLEKADCLQKALEAQNPSAQVTTVTLDTEDWHQKFADKFSDTITATDTSYISPNLSIRLSYRQYDTGKLDHTDSGKHEKYGTASFTEVSSPTRKPAY